MKAEADLPMMYEKIHQIELKHAQQLLRHLADYFQISTDVMNAFHQSLHPHLDTLDFDEVLVRFITPKEERDSESQEWRLQTFAELRVKYFIRLLATLVYEQYQKMKKDFAARRVTKKELQTLLRIPGRL